MNIIGATRNHINAPIFINYHSIVNPIISIPYSRFQFCT